MNTSPLGHKFDACREGLVRHAYADDSKHGPIPIYSIGFGSQTPKVRVDDVIEYEEAFERLKHHVALNDASLAKLLPMPVPQHMWDALGSLYYQKGSRAVEAVADWLKKGEYDWACWEFKNWNSGANGIPTKGHSHRRAKEMILAWDGNYGDLSTYPYWDHYPGPMIYKEFP